ncbi:nectin-1-like isoform X1 [Genypterus blacodes]|uniref:nectin-1-like isoform X1 n=1 Tax=Genypterus blacodes TaxID=154954 RepID=UPI003F766C65
MLPASLLWLWPFKAGASSQVTGRGDASAEFGGDAQYQCALADSTGVLQVTWQRLQRGASIQNLATYSRRFGEQVNQPQQGKIVFTEALLNSTSITVKNLQWPDEACYICSFNVYPDGSTRKQMCLSVHGISSVETNVSQVHSRGPEGGGDMEVLLSCSATGKPEPTIEWQSWRGVSSDPRSSVVSNRDGTFTSSSQVTLRPSPEWDGSLDCLVNAGRRGERREHLRLPSVNGHQEKDGEQKGVRGRIETQLIHTHPYGLYVSLSFTEELESR